MIRPYFDPISGTIVFFVPEAFNESVTIDGGGPATLFDCNIDNGEPHTLFGDIESEDGGTL